MMDEISIVIPCYNASKYIQRCLASIEKCCEGCEVIIVDDSSTDRSIDIIRRFEHRLNLKLRINEKNVGPGASRNIGVSMASKEYVMFVDADDTLEEGFSQAIGNYLAKNFDCIIFDAKRVFKNKTIDLSMFMSREGLISAGKISPQMGLVYMRASAYGKLYKTCIIKDNNIKFSDTKKGEEYAFAKAAISKCKRIFYVQNALYHYYDNPGSLIHQEGLDSEELRNKIYREVCSQIDTVQYAGELDALYFFLVVVPVMMNVIGAKHSSNDVRKKYNMLMRGRKMRDKYDKGYEFKFRLIFFALRHRLFWFARIILLGRALMHAARSR